jgi:hypothetical protein
MSAHSYTLDRPAVYRGLMERMAHALGIDLKAALEDDNIDQGQIERLKLRCSLCDRPDDCARLLSAHPNIESAPDYCVNSRTLAELAANGPVFRQG